MTPTQVVVAYDHSPASDVAITSAVDLACRAPEHVLHVVIVLDRHTGQELDPGVAIDYRYADQLHRELIDRLRLIFATRAPVGEVHFFVHVLFGDATTEILRVAAAVGADLIIVGSHGRTGVRRLVLGSVSEQVVRNAQCPVIVARPKAYEDVVLDDVIEVPEHPLPHRSTHRYAYTSSMIQPLPAAWPLR